MDDNLRRLVILKNRAVAVIQIHLISFQLWSARETNGLFSLHFSTEVQQKAETFNVFSIVMIFVNVPVNLMMVFDTSVYIYLYL